MRPTVVMLHGSGRRAHAIVREDSGDQPYVDVYHRWQGGRGEFAGLMHAARVLSRYEALVLIGFSIGGKRIADLADWFERTGRGDLIRAGVVIESPIKQDYPPAGKFPVLQIWNDGGVKTQGPRRQAEVARSIELWNYGRELTQWEGVGGHTRRVWKWSHRPWFLGHDFDLDLMPRVGEWLDETVTV